MNSEVKNTHRNRKKNRVCYYGLQLFAVQSSACVLLLLVIVLLRVIGGNVIEDVALQFNNAMMQKPFLAVSAYEVNEKDEVNTAISTTTSNVTFCAPLTGGVITSYYGEREDPFNAAVITYHNGVDIAAVEGTPLVAMLSGIVEEAGFDENGYGNYVVVACDDNKKYLYAHCSSVVCTQGQKVTNGQTIAFVGNTGKSTGSHVHVEWYENDTTIDPLLILPKETYA